MAWLNGRGAFIPVQRPGQGVVRLSPWLLPRVARRFEGGITQFVAGSRERLRRDEAYRLFRAYRLPLPARAGAVLIVHRRITKH